jgi:uncharacterized membrane protein YdjX (TVP38/TMEM64 family)
MILSAGRLGQVRHLPHLLAEWVPIRPVPKASQPFWLGSVDPATLSRIGKGERIGHALARAQGERAGPPCTFPHLRFAHYLALSRLDPSTWLDAALPLLRSPLGAVLFIPLYALWVTLLLPGVWASMLAGALYGTLLGSALVFVGASLGALAVFVLGRTWLQGWARRRLAAAPKLQAVEQAVSREGLRLVLLTRLSPAFPFSLLNLAYGLSEVSLWDYTIGLIGILPGTILFCGLGALAGDVARFQQVLSGEADPLTWALRLLGLGATLAVVWLVNRVAREALQQEDPGGP